MITKKALQQVLDAAQKAEDAGPCWCTDEDCEYDHEEDLSQYPSHVITFVNPDGSLNKQDNKKYLAFPWGVDGPLDFVIDHPQSWPDDAPRMVVVERASRSWACATAYL